MSLERCKRIVPAVLALTGACLFLATRASSQEDVVDSFGESMEVLVVNLEVVVTDPRGDRVTGLGRDDFRLLVNGRETPIAFFSEVREGRTVTTDSGAPGQAPPSSAQAPAPELAAPAATHHLVFIDDYFGLRRYRNTVLRGIRERLASLPAGDSMAVVAFDGEKIDLLAPWTSSREELSRVLDAAAKRPAHGLLRAHERRRRGESGPMTEEAVQAQELDRVLTAVRSTFRSVPAPEGRKVLLLLAGGWPVRSSEPEPDEAERAVEEVEAAQSFATSAGPPSPVPEDGADVPSPPGAVSRTSSLDDLGQVRELADAANHFGYTVYPVDVQGLRGHSEAVAETAPATDPATGLAVPGASSYTPELFRQGTLRSLASETGGRALLFGERAEALASVVADTGSYYSLGFTPRLDTGGARQRVQLEVDRPGLRIRARKSWRDLSRTADLDLLVESALQFDTGAGTAVAASAGDLLETGGTEDPALDITLGEPRPSDDRLMTVPLRVAVPWEKVTLLPTGSGLVARLEVRIAVRDRRGNLSDITRFPFNVVRQTPPPPERRLRLRADLVLRRERHTLVLILYDAVSHNVMQRRLTVEP